MKNKEENVTTISAENIYLLNGRVPLEKAIPFGLQHVLAMFVSNLAPVLIVCSYIPSGKSALNCQSSWVSVSLFSEVF